MMKWEDPLQSSAGAASAANLDPPEISNPLAPPGNATASEATGARRKDVGRRPAGSNKIINSPDGNGQAVSLIYDWALKKYLDSCSNHWMPYDISMHADVRLWRDPQGLTADERAIIKRNLGFLSAADALAANNLVLAIYRHITNPECRQYLLRQAFESTLHTHACRYVIESLGLDSDELHHLHHDVPAIARKSIWAQDATQHLSDPNFQTGSDANDQVLLRELVSFYVIFAGIFSQVGFTQILSMGRRNKMAGTAEQFRHILHDLSRHMYFGMDVINQIKVENPHLWTENFKRTISQMLRDAVVLETQYAYDTMPRGILGLNAPMCEEYLQFVANRRCAQIGLSELFPGATNPFPWVSEAQGRDVGMTVFEQRPADNQAGGVLNWD